MILVTGAAGFIGHHLLHRLLTSTSDTVVGFDNLRRGQWTDLQNSDYVRDGRLQLVAGDVRDFDMCQQVMQDVDTVFHLAGQSNVMGSVTGVKYSFEANVTGTFNILHAAQLAGVRCVVFASSREVYGEAAQLPVKEDSPLGAKNPYGASKIAAEAYCRVFDSPDMRVAILRLANVYGPGDRGRVIPIFVDRVKQGLPLVLYGGDQVIDFVPMELVVDAFIRASQVHPASPINVGSGQGTTLKGLAERILSLANATAGYEVVPARSPEVVRFTADVDNMRNVLQITPPQDPLCALPALIQ